MKQLILRTCKEDLTSYNRFQWKLGKNIAPDWDPIPEIGNGLHGLLWGEGAGNLLNYSPNAKWLVAEIDQYIDLKGKVKFPKCNVIFIGNREQTTQFLYQNSNDKAISGLIMKGNNLKGGDYSELTSEDCYSVIKAKIKAKIKASDYSTITTDNYAHITTRNWSKIITGFGSTIVAGHCSTIVAGNGTITTGDYSHVTTGNNSTVTTGYNSTIKTGNDSQITYNKKTTNVNNGTYYCNNGEIICN